MTACLGNLLSADAQLLSPGVDTSQRLLCTRPFFTGKRHGMLQGIASDLLRLVVSHAESQNARAVYLHVVSYNTSAMAFYRRNAFEELSLLRDFYYIA